MSDADIIAKTLAAIPVGYLPAHTKENIPDLVTAWVQKSVEKEAIINRQETIIDALCEKVSVLEQRLLEAQQDRDTMKTEKEKLQKFKDFVHQRLDAMGIPTNPDGVHSAAGCRIGDRLDIVQEHVRAQS
jgi:hypothetical protein